MSPRLAVRKTYKLYVGGAFARSESGRHDPVLDHEGSHVANITRASRKDVRDAVKKARAAQAGWAGKTAYNRGQVLYRAAEALESRSEEFAQQAVALRGAKPAAARDEVAAAVDALVHYAGWTDKLHAVLGGVNPVAAPFLSFSTPEPTGVVGVVAPEEPELLGLVGAIAPALAAGNAVVAICSERWPLAGLDLGEVLAVSDVPGGVVNLLAGRRDELARGARRPPRPQRDRRRQRRRGAGRAARRARGGDRQARRADPAGLRRAGGLPAPARGADRAQDRLAPDRCLSAVLSTRQLNRTLLERQLLLRRAPLSPAQAIEHLAGMQCQEPPAPFYGLWSRLERFDAAELVALLEAHEVLRTTLMRVTLHLTTTDDFLAWRPMHQAMIEKRFAGSPFAKQLDGADVAEVVAAGHAALAETPGTTAEIGRALAERWPGADPTALAYAVRFHAPLAQLPPRGTSLEKAGGQAVVAPVPELTGRELAAETAPDALILRYLAAFGPGERVRHAPVVRPAGPRRGRRAPAPAAADVRRRARPRAARPPRTPRSRPARSPPRRASCRGSTTSCSATTTARACSRTATGSASSAAARSCSSTASPARPGGSSAPSDAATLHIQPLEELGDVPRAGGGGRAAAGVRRPGCGPPRDRPRGGGLSQVTAAGASSSR